jgi:hypothetical protein
MFRPLNSALARQIFLGSLDIVSIQAKGTEQLSGNSDFKAYRVPEEKTTGQTDKNKITP